MHHILNKASDHCYTDQLDQKTGNELGIMYTGLRVILYHLIAAEGECIQAQNNHMVL